MNCSNPYLTARKEKQILAMLRNHGRIKAKDAAKKLHIPFEVIGDTIKNNDKIIKYTAMLDFYKLGYQIRLFLALSVQSKQVDETEDYLKRCPNVNSILKINNGYNFMCELYFKNLQESTIFIEILTDKFHIFHKDEYYILRSVTEQKFMTNPEII